MEDLRDTFGRLSATDLVTIIAIATFMIGLLLVAANSTRRSSPIPIIGGAALCFVGFSALIVTAIFG